MIFNPLDYPVCLEFPLWLQETAWAEHIPFAMFLTAAVRPRVLVELGAYRGVSYCAFCQAVKFTSSNTKCYAVDTWAGDEHAGQLEEGVLAQLRAHHDPHYSSFSRLVQSTFDDALKHFDDGSVDLLHIDGFHTLEAVTHDFETWKSKISDRGITIFHDINVRERNFGVWKFWEAVKKQFPHFEFLNSHGLGVLAVGENIPENLRFLFAADEAQSVAIRQFFSVLGERVEAQRQCYAQEKHLAELSNYESIIKNSRFLRAYRVWKNEDARGVLKKTIK